MACTYTYTYTKPDRTDREDPVTFQGGVLCMEYEVDITCKGECPEGSSGDCDTPFWDKNLMVCIDYGAIFHEDKHKACIDALAACDGSNTKCVAAAHNGPCETIWRALRIDVHKLVEFEKAFDDAMKAAIDKSGFCNCGAQSNTLQPNTIQLILDAQRDETIKRIISRA
tara:strand:+ start:1699 stop:2205 length:507 start_codon:yes stop_codon:yes gene_type:complete